MQIKEFQISINETTWIESTLYSPDGCERTKNTENRDLIILCHGFSGDQQEWGRFPEVAKKIVNNGWWALTFDFRGSGKNKRELITIDKQVEDLESVYQWAKVANFKNISILGLSFGGLTSMLAELPNRLTSIFWAPAFYMKKILGIRGKLLKILTRITKSPVKIKSASNLKILIDHTFLSTIEKIPIEQILHNYNKSCLIIQGTSDHVVLPKYNKSSFQFLPKLNTSIENNQEYIQVSGASHEFQGKHLDSFICHSIEWLERYHDIKKE